MVRCDWHPRIHFSGVARGSQCDLRYNWRDAHRRLANVRRTIRRVRLGNCNCKRKRIEMEKCAVEIEKFWNKTDRCHMQHCNDEPKLRWRRSKKNRGGPLAKNKMRGAARSTIGAGSTWRWIVAHAPGRRSAPREALPGALPKARFDGLFAQVFAHQAGCAEAKFRQFGQ